MMPVRMTPFKGRCPGQSDAKRRRVRPPETKRSGRREAAAAGATRDDEAAPVPKRCEEKRPRIHDEVAGIVLTIEIVSPKKRDS